MLSNNYKALFILKTSSFYILLYIYLNLCAKRKPLNSFIFTNKFILRNFLNKFIFTNRSSLRNVKVYAPRVKLISLRVIK